MNQGSSSSVIAPLNALAPNILYVNESQRGNPVINHLKNVKWHYTSEIKADYLMNSTGALFLSVRYHHRHPKYIIRRIEDIASMYRIRILLVLIDDEQQLPLLQELNRLAFISNFVLLFTWSNLEAARYLETFKNYEHKSAQSIQSKEENEFLPKVHKLLSTHIKSVNKTDVITLLDVFQNVRSVFQAKEEELILCPGIGEKKAKRLYSVFHEPFLRETNTKSTSTSVYEVAAAASKSNLDQNETSNNREAEEEQSKEENPSNRLETVEREKTDLISNSSFLMTDQVEGTRRPIVRKRKIAEPEIIEIDDDF